MPHRRAEAEANIIECSDAVLASCTVEADQIASLYGGDPGRIRIVAPGVDHAFFGPGPPAPGPAGPRAARATGACCCSSGASSRSSAPTSPSRRSPSCPHRSGQASGLPPGRRGWPERAARGEGAAGAHRRGRRQGRARPVHVVDAAAARAAVLVLPRCGRLHRAEPVGVVRPGGPGGGGVRHPGGGLRRRGPDHAGRSRAHGLPGRRARPALLRRRGAPDLRRATGWPSASPPPRCCGRAATRGGPPRRGWWSCTTSWPRAVSSSAAEPRPAARRPCRSSTSPRRRRWPRPSPASTPGPDASWPSGRLPGGGRAPGGDRPHRVVPVVPPLQGRGEGLHHRVVHAQAADARTTRPSSCPRPRPTRRTSTPT